MPKSKRRKQRVAEASRQLQRTKKKIEKDARKGNNATGNTSLNGVDEVSNNTEAQPFNNNNDSISEPRHESSDEEGNGWLGYTFDNLYTGLAKVRAGIHTGFFS